MYLTPHVSISTTNFVHTNPNLCVSIGLAINKQPTLGVVYSPIYKELFISIKGYGAYLNGNKIKVSSVTALKDSIVVSICISTSLV